MASSGAGRGNAPGSAPSLRPTITQQQQAEMMRKNRKCVSCGNTAMQKCDFRACGTCCTRNRNPCPVHGLKQSGTAAASTPETHLRPQYQWPTAAPRMGMMPGYMRPPNGHVPSSYMNPAMIGYRMPYASPVVRMPTAPPVETEAEKEARLEKARKAFIRQQREAIMVNSWRVNKMKAYADAELSFEDEAFDRYMRSAGLLEEVAGVDADILAEGENFSAEYITQDERLPDADLARHDSKHKERQRQKLQKAITKSFQKLRKRDGDADSVLEREFNQVGFGRRDTKRMKVQTTDGKECLRRINAWEDLFQSIGSFSDMGDVRLFLDLYKKNFGRDLGSSLPHLFRKDGAAMDRNEEREKCSLKDIGAVVVNASEQPTSGQNSSEPRITGQIRNPVIKHQEAIKENIDIREQQVTNQNDEAVGQLQTDDQQEATTQLDEVIDKQEAAKQAEEVTDQQNFEKQIDEVVDQQHAEKQNNQVTDPYSQQELTEKALVHQEAAIHSDEGVTQLEAAVQSLDEQGESKEQQEFVKEHIEEGQAQAQQDAAMQILDQQEASVEEALDEQQEAAVRSDSALDQQEAVIPEKGASLEQETENWLVNAPRLPVRKLVMNLIKQKPLKVADFCKVDLDEQSLRRVFDNHHRYYILETVE